MVASLYQEDENKEEDSLIMKREKECRLKVMIQNILLRLVNHDETRLKTVITKYLTAALF